MKYTALLFVLSGTLLAAQTTKPAAPKPKTARPATAAGVHHAAAAGCEAKLPATAPAAPGPCHTEFTVSLRYKDIKLGTGDLAEPGKVYKVFYTGYLASDGSIFDSTEKHRQPELDADHKPVTGPDGKPKLADAEPFAFPQGSGRLIPGWDQGFEGMKVGGIRRLYIPYRLAYGELGRPPVIPPKSDLVFDIELLGVEDLPQRQMMNVQPRPTPPHPAVPGGAPAPGTPSSPQPTEKPAQPQSPQM